jgi:hypothetical protein
MAKIELSNIAPSEAVHFSIGNVEFDVPFESDDRRVVVAANSHPWLKVTPDKEELISGTFREPSVLPKDDVLSEQNSIAFDPEEIKKVEEAKLEVEGGRTAIEAGLDQTKVKETKDGTNLTIAAEEADAVAAEEAPSEETPTTPKGSSTTKKDTK